MEYDVEFKCIMNISDIDEQDIDDGIEILISDILSNAGYPDAYIEIINYSKR